MKTTHSLTLICALSVSFTLLLSSCGSKKPVTTPSIPVEQAPPGDGGGGPTDGGGGPTDVYGNTVVLQSYGFMFPTTATIQGSINSNFTINADPMCMTEAGLRSLSGTYFAVTGSLQREAGNNWPVKANTEFRRPDGTIIGTSNNSGGFDFPLTNSITATQTYVWTGLTSAFAATPSCSGWTANYAPSSGVRGDLGSITSSAISTTATSCNNDLPLLCVEKLKRVTTVPAQLAYRRIFVTIAPMLPTYGTNFTNGVARFDQQCQTDANALGHSNGGYTTYKAMVINNTTQNPTTTTRRNACLTANCGNGPGEAVNWVLEPSTEYRRPDKTTIIGTTTSGGIFAHPLTNSWTGVNEEYWTAQNVSWATATNAGAPSCVDWQSNASNNGAAVGLGNATDVTAVRSAVVACDQMRKVLCVEQKRTQTVFTEYPGY